VCASKPGDAVATRSSSFPGGASRVRVHAGIHQVSKKRHYLVETMPAGPTAGREAERVRTRFLRRWRDRCDRRRKDRDVNTCRPLAPATVRLIHAIMAAALGRAVRWGWVSINPALLADRPAAPKSDPQPPSVEQAARILGVAWRDRTEATASGARCRCTAPT